MARYKPTAKERRRYENLRANIKNIRKYLNKEYIRGRKESSHVANLPEIVLPSLKKPRKTFKSLNDFQTEIANMKKFTSIERYIATSYKKNLLEILRQQIDEASVTMTGFNSLPESYGRYSKTQKDDNPLLSGYMEMYNKIQRMSSKAFMDMYTKGYIVAFRYLYREIQTLAKRGFSDDDSNPYLQQQQDMFASYQQIMAYAGK